MAEKTIKLEVTPELVRAMTSITDDKLFTAYEGRMAYAIEFEEDLDKLLELAEYNHTKRSMSFSHMPDFMTRDFLDAYVTAEDSNVSIPILILMKRNPNIPLNTSLNSVMGWFIQRSVPLGLSPAIVHDFLWGKPMFTDIERVNAVAILITAGVDTSVMIDPPPHLERAPKIPFYLHAVLFIFAVVTPTYWKELTLFAAMWKLNTYRKMPKMEHFIAELAENSSDLTRDDFLHIVNNVRGHFVKDDVNVGVKTLKRLQDPEMIEKKIQDEYRRIGRHFVVYKRGVASYGPIDHFRMQALARFQRIGVIERFFDMYTEYEAPMRMLDGNLEALPNVVPDVYHPEVRTTFVRELLRNEDVIKADSDDWGHTLDRVRKIVFRLEFSEACLYSSGGFRYSPLMGFTLDHFEELFSRRKQVEAFYAHMIPRDVYLAQEMPGVYFTIPELHASPRFTFTFGSFLMSVLFYTNDRMINLVMDRLKKSSRDALQVAEVNVHRNEMIVHFEEHSEYVYVRKGPDCYLEYPVRKALADEDFMGLD